MLALTFSRKAAEQLRDRVTARLGRTMATTLSSTFHSFAYGLVRRYSPAELYAAPLRLLSAPEQDVVLQELLTDNPESVRWPDGAAGRPSAPAGFAREVHAVLARARERGLDPDDLVALGRAERVPEFEAAGLFLQQYLDVLGDQSAIDYPDLIARAVHRGRDRTATSCGARFTPRLRRRVPGHRPEPGRAAARARRRRPRPDRGRRPRPVDLRLPRRRRARHPRLPARRSRRADGDAGAAWSRSAPPAASARGCCAPSRSIAASIAIDRRDPARAVRRVPLARGRPTTSSAPAASRC